MTMPLDGLTVKDYNVIRYDVIRASSMINNDIYMRDVNPDLTTSIDGNLSAISMTAEEIAELREDSKLLYALIEAGVEDWEGYNTAIGILREAP